MMYDSLFGLWRWILFFINFVRVFYCGFRMGFDDLLFYYLFYSFNKVYKVNKVSDFLIYKLLCKFIGKMVKGSFIIKCDGFVILVKNGKIVLMCEDVCRRNIYGDLDDVFFFSLFFLVDKYKNGICFFFIR